MTLIRDGKTSEFPDAITTRGSKHIKTLMDAHKKGYECYVLFLVQIENCKNFRIAKDIYESLLVYLTIPYNIRPYYQPISIGETNKLLIFLKSIKAFDGYLMRSLKNSTRSAFRSFI